MPRDRSRTSRPRELGGGRRCRRAAACQRELCIRALRRSGRWPQSQRHWAGRSLEQFVRRRCSGVSGLACEFTHGVERPRVCWHPFAPQRGIRATGLPSASVQRIPLQACAGCRQVRGPSTLEHRAKHDARFAQDDSWWWRSQPPEVTHSSVSTPSSSHSFPHESQRHLNFDEGLPSTSSGWGSNSSNTTSVE
jgi:hypothetical protein